LQEKFIQLIFLQIESGKDNPASSKVKKQKAKDQEQVFVRDLAL